MDAQTKGWRAWDVRSFIEAAVLGILAWQLYTTQEMSVTVAVIKERTEDFKDSAPNRWTRQMHEQYSTQNDLRFDNIEQRLRNLEKRR